MIRINLIAEARAEKKTRKPLFSFDAGNEAIGNVVMTTIIVMAMLFCGYKYISMRATLSDLGVKISEANQERERLKEILKKGEEFKAQRELLKRKVDLITQLKKNQSVPVHLLDQISKNLPDFLWLDALNERGNGISLAGKATNYNAVSNLYNNLRDSNHFVEVIMGTTQEVGDGVSFSMNCKFVNLEGATTVDGENAAPGQEQAPVAALAASGGGES